MAIAASLSTRNGKRSRLRRLKDRVSQGAQGPCLTRSPSHFLFNIYICDLPTIVTRKYRCAEDVAIMHADGYWLAVEEVLSNDMVTAGEYLQTWKLKLSTTKTVSAVFHLNNKEAKRELKVNFNNKTLSCRPQIPRSNVGQVAHTSPIP